jgi:hypothetical protein
MIKKLVSELKDLILAHGYWSDEVREFNSKLDYTTMVEVNQKAIREIKYNLQTY